MPLYRTGDQFLVLALAVGVRSVEKIDAKLARPLQGFDRGRSVGLVVERRHRRAAEPDHGNFEPAEPASLHPVPPHCTLARSQYTILGLGGRVVRSSLAVVSCKA